MKKVRAPRGLDRRPEVFDMVRQKKKKPPKKTRTPERKSKRVAEKMKGVYILKKEDLESAFDHLSDWDIIAPSDPEKPLSLFRDKNIQLLPQILDIDINCDQRIGEIILEDTVGTIQGTIDLQVDYEIIAADVLRCAGTGLNESSLLFGQQQESLSLFDWLSRHPEVLDELMRFADNFMRDLGGIFEDSFGQWKIDNILMDKDFLRYEI